MTKKLQEEAKKYWKENKIAVTLVSGFALGLLVAFAIQPTVITNNNEKIIEKQTIDKRPGKVTADEICSSIYGADYGWGDGLANVRCHLDGQWYSLGAKDLNQALNSSYSLEAR